MGVCGCRDAKGPYQEMKPDAADAKLPADWVKLDQPPKEDKLWDGWTQDKVLKLFPTLPQLESPVVCAQAPNKAVTYYGQYKNGMRHGRGRLVWNDGTVNEGYWSEDKLNGVGKRYQDGPEGFSYEGEFKDGLYHGKGTFVDRNDDIEYLGEFAFHRRSGKGKLKSLDFVYEGEFKNNLKHGFGKIDFNGNRWYEGEWKNDKMDGKGEFHWKDGRYYKGAYLEDKKHGYGEFKFGNGDIYKGNWAQGVQHGEGILIEPMKPEKKGVWEQGILKV